MQIFMMSCTQSQHTYREEALITNHLRDYVPNLDKYKWCKKSPCRKIEIRRIAICFIILFFKLKLLQVCEAKSWPEHIIMSRVCHNHSFLLTLALKNWDMCHHNISYGMIKI